MVDTSGGFVSGKTTDKFSTELESRSESNTSPYSRRILIDLVAASDMVLMVAAGIIAKLFYIDYYLTSDETLTKYVPPVIYCLVCFYALMNNRRYYSPQKIFSIPHRIPSILTQVFFAFSFVFIILFFLKTSSHYSRGWIFCWFTSYCFLLTANRLAWSIYIKSLIRKGVFQKRVAIIGSGSPLKKLLTIFGQDNYEHRLSLTCDLSCSGKDESNSKVQQCKDITALIAEGQNNKFDQVIVALPASESGQLEKVVKELRLLPIDIQILPDLGDVRMPLVHVEQVGDLSVVNIERKPISDWGIFVKNAADYIIGAIALIAFMPIMALVAVVIKLDSPGPVFYRQKRHGFNHKIINVLKFRTMQNAEPGTHGEVLQASRNDKRITTVGAILRKTSLDELPQLINVLRGEMSLVGPRPHAIEHNSYYGKLVENYANRHRVKPGITGWAQVNGLRGGTEDHRLMEERVKYDLEYIENWSIWLDIKILFMTPIYGFVSKNAY
ncbi:MAG: undecaprenyl-phosphate glucose phosphotransferase [Methyloligellaceae bacterium]